MIRNAFTMKLYDGQKAEYRKRHEEIWPELVEELRKAGIRNYSIFLDSTTGTLFGYQELTEDNSADDLAATEVMKRWWKHMADIMETNPDDSPQVGTLDEVFHMD